MLLEGALAVIVILACCAGVGMGVTDAVSGKTLTGRAAWETKYQSEIVSSVDPATGNTVTTGGWANHRLPQKIGAFVEGGANFLTALGMPFRLGIGIVAVLVASFAATTLDTATRLQRYIVSEIAQSCRLPAAGRKHPATFIAVSTALLLAFSSGGGKGALALWPLFGAVNQLLGGLALLVITVWLARRGIPIVFTAAPMLFMVLMTGWAMKINLAKFYAQDKWLLFSIGSLITVLQLWMVIEGLMVLIRLKRK